jgi:hypothetical protein
MHTTIADANRQFLHGQQTFDNIENHSQLQVLGFTELLPMQGGIPGWRRICFVIYETKPEALPLHSLPADPWSFLITFNKIRGYEGMLLPGGKIMLGRWSNLLELGQEGGDGPFIFWEV